MTALSAHVASHCVIQGTGLRILQAKGRRAADEAIQHHRNAQRAGAGNCACHGHQFPSAQPAQGLKAVPLPVVQRNALCHHLRFQGKACIIHASTAPGPIGGVPAQQGAGHSRS